jgi:GTP-binding protein EngB required for normal cell division
LIEWYLFQSPYRQKRVVFIIDAEVGPTDNDLEMLRVLEETRKTIVIVANKIDKISKSKTKARLKQIQDIVGNHKIIPYSSDKKIGMGELAAEIFG